MDLSIEAIEADLARAEQTLGRPESAIHMQRAQVRATLLAAQPKPVLQDADEYSLPRIEMLEQKKRLEAEAQWADSADVEISKGVGWTRYQVPDKASAEDRATAARYLLGIHDKIEPILLWDPDRSHDERIRMAAGILGLGRDELRAILDPTAGTVEPEEEEVVVEPDPVSDDPDEIDADFARLRKR